MRYSQIRSMDISNGEGIGVALFVQGCHFHCKDCFNQETWDFNGGKDFTNEVKEEFLKLIDKPYIKRISILGGEPLAHENVIEIDSLLHDIRSKFLNTKQIWIYTGNTFEEIMKKENVFLQRTLGYCDVLVDGRFEIDKKDFNLKFRGSSNQRIWKRTNHEWRDVTNELFD